MNPPLAERFRPQNFAEYVGQRHLLGKGCPLAVAIAQKRPFSMILWGEAGCGKTTLALLLAKAFALPVVQLSAVSAGVKEIRAALATGDNALFPPLVFIDEIHRFSHPQQDCLLPALEKGKIILLGATTENPAFHLHAALLSRVRVLPLRPLQAEELLPRLQLACEFLSFAPPADDLLTLAKWANGDARQALNDLEQWALLAKTGQSPSAALEIVVAGRPARGDNPSALLSAFHKSLRGSSPDGALYWLARLLAGGVDALVVARRMLCVASEDIGNADPNALNLALNAYQTYERLGAPEGHLALAQAATYLALAPKSNASYLGLQRAMDYVATHPPAPVPAHLCNVASAGQHSEPSRANYRYPHDEKDAFAAGQSYLPPEMTGVEFYAPQPRGLEMKLGEKLARLRQLDDDATP